MDEERKTFEALGNEAREARAIRRLANRNGAHYLASEKSPDSNAIDQRRKEKTEAFAPERKSYFSL